MSLRRIEIPPVLVVKGKSVVAGRHCQVFRTAQPLGNEVERRLKLDRSKGTLARI